MSVDLIEQATYQPPWLEGAFAARSSERRAGSVGAHLRQVLPGLQAINLLEQIGFSSGPGVAGYGAGIAGQPPTMDAGPVRLSFSSPQVNIEFLNSTLTFSLATGQMTVSLGLASAATLQLEVTGAFTKAATEFKPEAIAVSIDVAGEEAETIFVASTFVALFGLSPLTLQMPGIGLAPDNLEFDLSLKQIGEQLRTSKTAYKLMVVGKATGNRMDFPIALSGEELQTLNLIYRAIAETTFDWPIASYPLRAQANQEAFERLSALRQPTPMTFVRENVSQELLGRVIRLGTMKVFFENSAIQDREHFLESLASGDGRDVETKVIALNGRATIACPDAPRLPDTPWTVEQRRLIALGPVLCELLANRYNELAAGTLAGLTEEDKAEITTRPELDEDAHLIGDRD